MNTTNYIVQGATDITGPEDFRYAPCDLCHDALQPLKLMKLFVSPDPRSATPGRGAVDATRTLACCESCVIALTTDEHEPRIILFDPDDGSYIWSEESGNWAADGYPPRPTRVS